LEHFAHFATFERRRTGTRVACHIPSGPGAIQVVNALPGQRGNMKLPLETVGRWFMDANFGKTFRISESKTVQIRFDALNVFNHAEIPDAEMIGANQTMNTPGLLFGRLSSKGGFGTGGSPRTLSAQIRIGNHPIGLP
jgi:hypothetical protein